MHLIHKETFEVNKASKKDKALPRLLFQGKFNLSDEKFEQGLQEGQFFQVKDEHGRLKYSWEELEHSHESGSSSKLSLGASKALTLNEAKVEKAAFSTWSKGLFGQVNPKSLPAAPQLIPLEDQKATLTETQWQQAQAQLIEAIGAFEKMSKEVKKHLQVLGYDKEDTIYVNLHLGLLTFEVLLHESYNFKAYIRTVKLWTLYLSHIHK